MGNGSGLNGPLPELSVFPPGASVGGAAVGGAGVAPEVGELVDVAPPYVVLSVVGIAVDVVSTGVAPPGDVLPVPPAVVVAPGAATQ